METKQNTFGDRQRLAVSKFGAESSNLNEDFERPLTAMKDCQRPWKTANDWQWFPTTQIFQWLRKTVNDTQRLVTTIWKPGFSYKACSIASGKISCLYINSSVEDHRIFPSVLPNAVVTTIRVLVHTIQFDFTEADIPTFEIRITAWRKRNQNRRHSFLWFSADCNSPVSGNIRNYPPNYMLYLISQKYDWLFHWLL